LDNFDWTTFYQELDVPALTFFYNEHVKDFYNLADLIICRAGAGTIFEVAFFEKPCIVIPLVAHSTSHQVDNAHEIAKQYPHLFTMIEQSTITATSTVFHETIIKKLRMHNS
jgi:UDP-N-acetylglucosamine--N-acetylmuramyl-(pentapeptide) pyrophosphoryl-undecaprenol N-acetylglucosamine transferase